MKSDSTGGTERHPACPDRFCTGCGACFQACPRHAVTMKPDAMGFLHPETDSGLCVKCGLCDAVCPVLSPLPPQRERSFYAARNKDENILKSSSSGGIFSLLAEDFLNRNGKVYGAAFANGFHSVIQRSVETAADLELLRGSKYLQGSTEQTFSEVKNDLEQGRPVLYSGVACQLAGLKKYLGKLAEDPNLIYVDVLCHGASSPAVWRAYFNHVCKTQEVENVLFRDKVTGWEEFS